MNKNKKVVFVKSLCYQWKKNRKYCSSLSALNISPESLFISRASELLDAYLMLVSELTGIEEGALGWFVWENDCGEKCGECRTAKGISMKIDSPETFVDFEELP